MFMSVAIIYGFHSIPKDINTSFEYFPQSMVVILIYYKIPFVLLWVFSFIHNQKMLFILNMVLYFMIYLLEIFQVIISSFAQ